MPRQRRCVLSVGLLGGVAVDRCVLAPAVWRRPPPVLSLSHALASMRPGDPAEVRAAESSLSLEGDRGQAESCVLCVCVCVCVCVVVVFFLSVFVLVFVFVFVCVFVSCCFVVLCCVALRCVASCWRCACVCVCVCVRALWVCALGWRRRRRVQCVRVCCAHACSGARFEPPPSVVCVRSQAGRCTRSHHHRSHFGSRYTLGRCACAGLFCQVAPYVSTCVRSAAQVAACVCA